MADARFPARSEPVNSQPVFPTECDGSNRVFDGIVVNGQVSGAGIADQALPTPQGVVDGFGGTATIGGMGAGL